MHVSEAAPALLPIFNQLLDREQLALRLGSTPSDEILSLFKIPYPPFAIEFVSRVIRKSESVWRGVLSKSEGEVLKEETAKFVRAEILKEAILSELVKAVGDKNSIRSIIANPTMVDSGRSELTEGLSPQVISNIVNLGWAVFDGQFDETWKFLNDRIPLLRREFVLLDAIKVFTRPRNFGPEKYPRSMEIAFSDIDRKDNQLMWKLAERLLAVPFEINKKAPGEFSLFLNTNFQVASLRPSEIWMCSHSFDVLYITGSVQAEFRNRNPLLTESVVSVVDLSKGCLLLVDGSRIACSLKTSCDESVYLIGSRFTIGK